MAATYYPTTTNSSPTFVPGGTDQVGGSRTFSASALGSANTISMNWGIQNFNVHWAWMLDASETSGRADGSVTYTYNFFVSTANMNVNAANLFVARVNSSGVIQTSIVSSTTVSFASTGAKSLSVTGDLGTFGATDRLVVSVRVANTTGMTQSAAMEIGLANGTEEFTAPWTVATNFTRNIDDTLIANDALAFQETKFLTPADSVTVSDLVAAERGIAAGVVDSVSVSDVITPQTGKEASVSDAVTVADSQNFAIGETLGDAVVVGDVQTFQRDVQQTINDSITLADSAITVVGFARAVSDAAALTDMLVFGYSGTVVDTATLVDALITAQGFARTAADSLLVLDALSFDYGEAVADAIVIADAQSRGLGPTFTEAIVIADAQIFDRTALIVDALNASDTIQTLFSGESAPYIHTRPPLDGFVVPASLGGLVFLVIANGVISVVDSSGLVASYAAAGAVVEQADTGIVAESDQSGASV